MANYRDINSASRNLNRVADINLAPENRAALEATMVALVAGGRVQEGALVAQMIEKTSVQTDIVEAIGSLKQVIAGIKQPATNETDELTQLREENARLKALNV
jgi:hypothetical protein